MTTKIFLEILLRQFDRIPDVNVSVAHNFEEAVAMLSVERFGLVVSDWALDDRCAPEVFCQADPCIKRSECNALKTPILFMSGSHKVGQTKPLDFLKNFEPVSFILKRFGPRLIANIAEDVMRSLRLDTRPQPPSLGHA